MAHEMSHVRNYDIRFAMLMAVMVGSIVLLADVVRREILKGLCDLPIDDLTPEVLAQLRKPREH